MAGIFRVCNLAAAEHPPNCGIWIEKLAAARAIVLILIQFPGLIPRPRT
jgi:hypothetical protein